MSYYKILGWWSLVILPTITLMGQQYLSTPVSSGWQMSYEGWIDDINEVKVALNCVSGDCTGNLTYLRSGDRFTLKGSKEADILTLEEYDQYNQLTGYLNGKFVGKTIEATWENAAQTIGSQLHLTTVEDVPNTAVTDCGDNKWIQAYRGVIQDKEVEMILQKADNNRVLGSAYFVKDKREIQIVGKLTSNNNLNLTLLENQRTLGSLRAIYRNNRELSASFYDTRNVQSFASFELLETIKVNCLEYADYYSSYDFLYPQSNDALFNQIMSFLTKDWVADCKSQTKMIRQQTATPVLRASQRGYSWTEVTLLKDDFLSGLLTYDNTWDGKKSTKVFNYDFANKASIELEDIFKNGFDYKSYVKEYIHDSFKKDVTYRTDISYQAWLDQQTFTLYTIGREGLYFFTDFHIVYGRQSVLIPYKKLKSNIKKQATIRRLF